MRYLFWIFLLATVPDPSVGEELIRGVAMPPAIFDTGEADRIIVVGFSDRHITRVQLGAPHVYRRRGAYQSSTWSKRVASQIEKDYALSILSEWSMSEVGVHCIVYRVPESLSTDKVLDELSRDERLEIVQRMQVFQTKANPYSDPYYELQSNIRSMGLEEFHTKSTGQNVTIAVIDTGIDVEHPDLAGQIASTKNFAAAISKGFSEDLHGTAVAGIIAARSNNGAGIVGIAPGAKLVGLKACWPDQVGGLEAFCNSFTLALAVNTAVKLGVKILNMSLTGPRDPLLELLLSKAIEKEMIVVAADSATGGDATGFPASMKDVIAVRSLPSRYPQMMAVVRDRLIAAPGSEILTTVPNGTYDFITGSSLAAAHVSGVIALMLELHPDLPTHRILRLLRSFDGSNVAKLLSDEENPGSAL